MDAAGDHGAALGVNTLAVIETNHSEELRGPVVQEVIGAMADDRSRRAPNESQVPSVVVVATKR